MARKAINQILKTRLHDPKTFVRMGKQGILYEYVLPYGANEARYYEEAIDVRSRKKITKYNNGKRAGQYQPVGDKRYFTYYQIRKMGQADYIKFYEDLLKQEDQRFLEMIRDILGEMIE